MTPAFAHLIDEGIANRVKAKRHLAAMSPERRAQLEQEWLAGEAINDRHRIEEERREIAATAKGVE